MALNTAREQTGGARLSRGIPFGTVAAYRRLSRPGALLVLSVLWWFCAAGEFHRLFGTGATWLALLLALAAGWALAEFETGLLLVVRSAPMSRPIYLAAFAAAVAVLAFASLHALTRPAAVSDWNHAYALDRGIAALLAGRSPYGPSLQAGAPFVELPGAFLLALPFHLLGGAALQNPFWLALFLLRTPQWIRTAPRVAAFSAAILLNPGFMRGFFAGDDYLVDALVAFLAAAWTMSASEKQGTAMSKLGGMVLLALAMSVHVTYWVLLPAVALQVGRRRGPMAGVGLAMGLLALFAAINLPFYFGSPAEFGPLRLVTITSSVFGGAGWLLLAVAFFGALLASFLPPQREATVLAIGVALAIALLPVIVGNLLRDGFAYYAVYAAPVFVFLGMGWGAGGGLRAPMRAAGP